TFWGVQVINRTEWQGIRIPGDHHTSTATTMVHHLAVVVWVPGTSLLLPVVAAPGIPHILGIWEPGERSRSLVVHRRGPGSQSCWSHRWVRSSCQRWMVRLYW